MAGEIVYISATSISFSYLSFVISYVNSTFFCHFFVLLKYCTSLTAFPKFIQFLNVPLKMMFFGVFDLVESILTRRDFIFPFSWSLGDRLGWMLSIDCRFLKVSLSGASLSSSVSGGVLVVVEVGCMSSLTLCWTGSSSLLVDCALLISDCVNSKSLSKESFRRILYSLKFEGRMRSLKCIVYIFLSTRFWALTNSLFL